MSGNNELRTGEASQGLETQRGFLSSPRRHMLLTTVLGRQRFVSIGANYLLPHGG